MKQYFTKNITNRLRHFRHLSTTALNNHSNESEFFFSEQLRKNSIIRSPVIIV